MSFAPKTDVDPRTNQRRTKGEGGIKKGGPGRRLNENFEKRKCTLLRKCNETVDKYQADIYIAVRRKGKCTIYTNCSASTWPPRGEDMVSLFSLFRFGLMLYRILTIQFPF